MLTSIFSSAATTALLWSTTLAGAPQKRADAQISNPKTPPVTIKGNAFFAGGKRFYIRGIDYQPGGPSAKEDPIAVPAACKRDLEYFKRLGINTLRVYSVDNAANHDECMKLFADAGIYLALDVNTAKFSLNNENSYALLKSYNDVYLQSLFATVDGFAKYDNTLLFFSGNEVIDKPEKSYSAPFIKAVTRDLKAYIKARNYRSIPVGYSAADVEENRFQMAEYMNCGDEAARGDFYAFNDYAFCMSDYETAGWAAKVKQYSSYSAPLFLSEFGCNKLGPKRVDRNFGEIASLYSQNMTAVYSGGLVYEYTEETSQFGLVDYNNVTGAVKERADFRALEKAYAKTPLPEGDGGYRPDGKASACPAFNQTSWVVTNTSLPVMPAGAQKLMKDGAGPGPGYASVNGSQWAGVSSIGYLNDTKDAPSNSTGKGSSTPGKSAGVAVTPFDSLVVLAVAVFVLL